MDRAHAMITVRTTRARTVFYCFLLFPTLALPTGETVEQSVGQPSSRSWRLSADSAQTQTHALTISSSEQCRQ